MNFSYDKVIITGAAGFIGSNILSELNKMGVEEIIAVDVLGSDEKWKNLVEYSFSDYISGEDFRKNYIQSDRELFEQGQTCAVIHMGACSSTTEKNAEYMMDNNFVFSKELAAWCLKRGYRFVYASSAATYGDGSQGYSDMEPPQKLRPLNVYGYSKQFFDLYSLRNSWLDQIAGIKFFNVYGPNEDHKDDMRSVVNKAFDQINDQGYVRLFQSHKDGIGDGEQRRDFVYVKDAVAETIFLAGNRNANGLFNMGSGVANTFKDLVTETFNAMGKTPEIEYIPMPEYLREKYQYYTKAEMEKIRSVGFSQPFHSLKDGVSDYIRHLQTRA